MGIDALGDYIDASHRYPGSPVRSRFSVDVACGYCGKRSAGYIKCTSTHGWTVGRVRGCPDHLCEGCVRKLRHRAGKIAAKAGAPVCYSGQRKIAAGNTETGECIAPEDYRVWSLAYELSHAQLLCERLEKMAV